MTTDENVRMVDSAGRIRERIQHDWRRAIIRALTEPPSDDRREQQVAASPIDRLAAQTVASVWPQVEQALWPVLGVVAPAPTEDAQVSKASNAGVRPVAWLGAEEVAPVLGMTAHTLRRLARTGQCPVVVRRIGGRWCFSRADLVRLVESSR